MLKNFVVRKEEGASAIEYALIAGLVALAVAIGATVLGANMSAFFSGLGVQLLGYLP